MDEACSKAIALIKMFEGCKLKAYQDPRAIWTIGWGTTTPTIMSFLDASSYVLPAQGVVWTQADADRALLEAIEGVIGAILKVCQDLPTSLNPNQEAALCDFVYNVGLGNFERSGLLKALRRGDLPGAADQLLLWTKIGSYTSPGLVRRRAAERALFLAAAE